MRHMESKKKFALLRIAFGAVWAIDAWFKWQPGFLSNFMSYLTTDGQPALVARWINFWIGVIGTNPHLFAVTIAVAETAIAISLIFGLFTKQFSYIGIVLCFFIWSVAEGCGGPYVMGSTDIGCAVIYIFVFAGLLIGNSSSAWSLDSLRRKVLA